MRSPSIASVQYTPNQVPQDAAEMQRFLFEELTRVSAAIRALAEGHLDKMTVAPAKPRDGDLRYADGINWKPNGTGGAGIWYFNGTTWILLG